MVANVVSKNTKKDDVFKPRNFKELNKLGLKKLRSLCVALDLESRGMERRE